MFKFIGSTQSRISFTIGRRSLVGCADTGSDLDFMSLRCVVKNGFKIDGQASQRTRVMVADGSIVKTVGTVLAPSMKIGQSEPFDKVFHVLPGLPEEAIFAEEFLGNLDAFNTCVDLHNAENSYQHSLNTLVNLGPIQAFLSRSWTPVAGDTTQQEHDRAIEAEIYRRNNARRAFARIQAADRKEAAKAVEDAAVTAFDARHVQCAHCVGEAQS